MPHNTKNSLASRRRQQNRPLNTSDGYSSNVPSSSGESGCSTENPPHPGPTGTPTSSETSSSDSTRSENVWTPWEGEMVVPENLVPLFLRTTAATAMQIVTEDLNQISEMLAEVPETEPLLEYTLLLKQATLNLTRVVLYGIVLQMADSPSDLLVPEHTLIRPDGRPLSKAPDA